MGSHIMDIDMRALLFFILICSSVTSFQIDQLLKILFQKQETLEDWENCGELGEHGDDGDKEFKKYDSSCLWDCEWIDNPYHKYYFPWSLITEGENQGSKCKNVQEVHFFTTAPRIPKKLNCLKDCFPSELIKCSPDSQRKPFQSARLPDRDLCPGNEKYWFSESLDNDLDCLINWSTALRTNIQNKGLLNNDVSGDSVSESEFFLADEVTNATHKKKQIKYMRATNAFEMALEICAFARFLNELNKWYNDDDLAYPLFG